MDHPHSGAGYTFGSGVVHKFLETNGMTHILRAHQLCMEGYASLFDNHLSTVWSAPNYCYRCGNSASILEVSPGGKMYFNVFEAAPENERDGPNQQAAQTAGGKVRVTLFLGSKLMAQRLTPLLPHSASRVFFVTLHMRTRCPSRPMTTFVLHVKRLAKMLVTLTRHRRALVTSSRRPVRGRLYSH